MRQGGQAVRWWVLGSAVLMVVGAFGPWVKALGQSVSGTDGSNDGWLVVAAAVIGGLLFYATRTSRSAGVWALLGGIAGIGITLYDRSHVQHAINQGGALARALVQIGWGLNLALAASVSMTIAAAVYLYNSREQEQALTPPSSVRPSTPAASSLPGPTSAAPPTPPPD
jgi:hypothetical protein